MRSHIKIDCGKSIVHCLDESDVCDGVRIVIFESESNGTIPTFFGRVLDNEYLPQSERKLYFIQL